MAIACHDILADAEQIFADAAAEAQFRNAIGRAYYACYHRASAFHLALPSPGIPSEAGGFHKQLADALASPTVKDDALARRSKRLGYLCRDLHVQRVKADYKLGETLTQQHAQQALAQARRLFALTEE